MIERLKDNKSLADVKVVARTCKEFYENSVDSFVLVSSDSDYWGLIEEMPQANFLIMVEHDKCSFALKDALMKKGIFYCYIDDFYSGGGDEIKAHALQRELQRTFDVSIEMNIYDALDGVLDRTRIEMTDTEKKKYLNKIKNQITVNIDEDGTIGLLLK